MHPWHGVRLMKSRSAFISVCQARLHEWDKIYRGEPISKSEWDSDDDIADVEDL
jgi:hypothetical protein